MTSKSFRSAVVLAAVVVPLAGAEIYLRQTGSRVIADRGSASLGGVVNDPAALIDYTPRGRRLIPNAHVLIRNHPLSRLDVRMDVNSHGFRDDEIPPHRAAGERRVLVLGDSITWADSVPVEVTFVEQAENLLRAAGLDTEVINGGVGDVGLREEVAILEERGLAIAPDVVLVVLYGNDSRPPWGFAAEAGSPGWPRRHSMLVDATYRRLLLWRWIRQTGEDRFAWVAGNRTLDWQHDRDAFLQLVAMARYDWGALWVDEEWKEIDEQLRRLKSLADEHRFRVGLVAFPVAFQVFADFVEDRPQRLLAERARRFDFAYLDLLPALRARRSNDMFFDQCHPSPKGHTLVAEELARFVGEFLSRSPES